MKIDDIGFYTLSEKRINQASKDSPMWRTELIITDACNFKCGYCRGLKDAFKKHLTYLDAYKVMSEWAKTGLYSIRFSGGEPTLHKNLPGMIMAAKDLGAERIAISTNGSASDIYYNFLIKIGVDDFSISLDACCALFAIKMAGTNINFNRLIENIRLISSQVYTTVGVVLTEENVEDVVEIVCFASDLGVADIRIILAAQYNKLLTGVEKIPKEILEKHPILKYRVNNILQGKNVRGLSGTDSHTCYLQLDDSVSAGEFFWPCVIYMREGGDPIEMINPNMREQKWDWMCTHNTYTDEICRNNCLDVCIEYNNRFLGRNYEKSDDFTPRFNYRM